MRNGLVLNDLALSDLLWSGLALNSLGLSSLVWSALVWSGLALSGLVLGSGPQLGNGLILLLQYKLPLKSNELILFDLMLLTVFLKSLPLLCENSAPLDRELSWLLHQSVSLPIDLLPFHIQLVRVGVKLVLEAFKLLLLLDTKQPLFVCQILLWLLLLHTRVVLVLDLRLLLLRFVCCLEFMDAWIVLRSWNRLRVERRSMALGQR